jgi:ElaB/YqjD/DUF883 family membrane-anchored ribosome-binding protein
MSGSATDPGDRSSAEIEREVESTRARLTGTLEELRDRASPGQLFEQALDYMRESGGSEFARNLGRQVRDNPMPLLLIGAGVGWLMLSGNRPAGRSDGNYQRALPAPDYASRDYPGRSYRGTARVYGGEADGPSLAERATAAAGEAKDRVGGAAEGLRDSLAGAADRAGEMAGQAYRSVADAASGAADSIGSAAASAAERARMAGHDARDGMGRLGDSIGSATASVAERARMTAYDAREGMDRLSDSTRQGMNWLMREQPLVLGAIGLALGAAVGALLPGTETEDRLMGETRDDLAERAKATAQEGYERVKETAGEHLEQAKDRLGGDNLSLGRVGEALGEAAREASEAVRDVARDAAGEAKSALGSGDDATPRPAERADQPRRTDSPGASATAAPVPNPTRPGPV